MSQQLWTAVDEYIGAHLLAEDPALAQALADADAAGLPPIAVTPNQGKLLELLMRVHRARTILELGTLGGYSTIWLARALPADGRLVTLELNPDYARIARANVDRAGVGERVEIRVGPALEELARMHADGEGPFDAIFIDADKNNYPGYLKWSLALSRPRTLLIGDNVVRSGAIVPEGGHGSGPPDAVIEGVRGFYELLAHEPRVDATAVQTVGAKGHDGFALGLVDANR